MIEDRQYQIDDVLQCRLQDASYTDDAGCRIWRGWKHRQGYGLLTIDGKRYLAHRIAYELQHGTIPKGVHICHHCDVTACINNDHLYAGDAKTNRADAMRRGRAKNPFGPGEQHIHAKLTTSQVLQIRKSGKKRKILASIYGVSIGSINKIKTRESWAHI